MKTQRVVLLGVIVLAVIVGFSLLKAQPGANPVLVFKGYGLAATNAVLLANFELSNTSGRAIWLCYSGTEFPLRAPFLDRPMVAQPPQTNVYSLSVGSFFMQGNKLPPGEKLLLEFPLISGKPALQVGVYYYVGTFKDGNDFLGNLGTRLLNSNASLKDKVVLYWDNSGRRFKAPKRYEVWCPQPVSFQASASNTATVHGPETMAVRDE